MDGTRLVDPAAYARDGYPHAEWAALRRNAPLTRFVPDGWPPFWAVTRHADIVEISKRPDLYLNGPGMTYVREAAGPDGDGNPPQMKTIINMDPPEHRAFRKIASPYFTPRALARLDRLVAWTARELVDGLGREGECDFVTAIAAQHPLKVLATILGIPEEQEGVILRLTNELFGSDDPELGRGGDRTEAIQSLFMDFHAYFSQVIEERRARPTDDLASVIANARIDGEPMGMIETMGYCLITFTAGHETTRGGIGGGLLALIEHPEERRRWADDLALTPTAVDEIVRYVTPVNHMVRTASRDCTLSGKKIREGDRLVLFYASANRDEAVFADADRLRVDRHPNPHLGFGIGEHFCLGAHLARKTTGSIFREFLSRLEHVALAGEPQRTASVLVPGLKHLPISYRLGPPRLAIDEIAAVAQRSAA